MMSSVFQQLLPVMYPVDGHADILTGKLRHPHVIKLVNETDLDIYTTHYIEPNIIKNAETKWGSWKLRHEIFDDVPKTEHDIIEAIVTKFEHPYYKRVTAIDRQNNVVYKLYSVEHRRNYAIQQQGDRWGDMVEQLCDNYSDICDIIEWIPNIDTNVHAAMYEYIPGETVDNMYCEVGRKYDTGHPDVVAGKLEPYWGTISCVNVNDYMYTKRKIINMYIDMCRSCKHMNLSMWNYQQTENEPDWTDRWELGDTRYVLNVDDWRMQNIVETPAGEWKYIKPDRLVMTDLTNATNRFVADMRNQTNITLDFNTIIKKYENTLVQS